MHKLIKLFLLTTILTTALDLQAQKAKYPKAMELRDLEKFVGMWDGNTTITVDTIPYKVQYHMNFRRTADGYGINMDEAFTDSALGELRGANLIGYGNDDKKIHWYSVNNMGVTYERVGQWNDSDNLVFTYATKKGEKKYDEVITYAFYANDEFTYQQRWFVDGKQIKQVFGKFKRRQPVAPKPNK
jgi:hypothetical protein